MALTGPGVAMSGPVLTATGLVRSFGGRYAVTGNVVAIGGRRSLAEWCERRAAREGVSAAERAWWQEVTGALIATG